MDRTSHMEIVFGDICGPMGKVDHPLYHLPRGAVWCPLRCSQDSNTV